MNENKWNYISDTWVEHEISVNNPIPALGGKEAPSVEEIRNLVRYNFSAQDRCVTIKDYQRRLPDANHDLFYLIKNIPPKRKKETENF
jgi:hypothetical protein